MKILQDELRNRQAWLIALAIAVVLLVGLLYISYERQKYIIDAGVKNFTVRLSNEFVDNELVAEALSVRFSQHSATGHCIPPQQFYHHADGTWTINAHQKIINPQAGAIVAREPSREAGCAYAAAGFIAKLINQINNRNLYAHRYLVAQDGTFFYWFNPADATLFDFTTSEMAQRPENFFSPPPRYYDRLLTKNFGSKGMSSTDIYEDKITETPGYSIVSYIYDLTQKQHGPNVGQNIIGYLVYDHTLVELRGQLASAFNQTPPRFLSLIILNRHNAQRLCLQGACHRRSNDRIQTLSDKYEVRYGLNFTQFLLFSPFGYIPLLAFPFLCWLLQRLFLRLLNRQDRDNRTDPLTGCLNRKIMDILRTKDLRGYAVTVIDCNDFKAINDNFGHDIGDRALQIIARRLRHGIRDSIDFVVRPGGDEFLIFLSATTVEQALLVTQRIARQIQQHQFIQRGEAIGLSISYGVAVVEHELDDAIRIADERMYAMKRQRHDARR